MAQFVVRSAKPARDSLIPPTLPTPVGPVQHVFRPFAMFAHGRGSFCQAGEQPAAWLDDAQAAPITASRSAMTKGVAGDGTTILTRFGFRLLYIDPQHLGRHPSRLAALAPQDDGERPSCIAPPFDLPQSPPPPPC